MTITGVKTVYTYIQQTGNVVVKPPVPKRAHRFHMRCVIAQFLIDAMRRMDELGIDERELAKRMKVDPAVVRRAMNSRNNMKLKTADSIAYALGLEITTDTSKEAP